MKNKLNKKGFTLVELLAVIVVLAIIIVIAAPKVLEAMNSATKKAFQMEGQAILTKAMELYMADDLLGAGSTTKCYTLSSLGITTTGNYKGYVIVYGSSLIGNQNTSAYYLYLTDNTYQYNNASYADVFTKSAPNLETLTGNPTVTDTCPNPIPPKPTTSS